MRSLQDFAEAASGDDLDDAPEHVGRMAVFPDLAGLMLQRQGGERLDVLGRAPVLAHRRGRVDELLHPRNAGEAVGEAGGVAHQVLDGDRALERDEVEPVAVLDADLRLGEGGDVLGQRIGNHQPPFLDQRHRRDRDDRLGHGIDAKNSVGGHRRPVGPQRRPGRAKRRPCRAARPASRRPARGPPRSPAPSPRRAVAARRAKGRPPRGGRSAGPKERWKGRSSGTPGVVRSARTMFQSGLAGKAGLGGDGG